MNSSQMLYKISNLQYSIRMKRAECAKAVSDNDEPAINVHNTDLLLLQEDLDKTIKAFNSIPADNPDAKAKGPQKNRKWWHNFFSFRPATNRK